MQAKLYCQACRSPIGQVNPDKLTLPLTADQFDSLMPERGVPKPFFPGTTWVDFTCPQCLRRPIIEPDKIMIETDGKLETVKIPTKQIEHVCETCGEVFKTRPALLNHMKAGHD
ncbi:C2H2-type zinc finger protein [Desulfobacter postgatei]|uniref:C2H2-type zinc finger protein n=1 Tax=Desulfobacter postgatei TaxID=2293 RepID=UPI002FDAFF71